MQPSFGNPPTSHFAAIPVSSSTTSTDPNHTLPAMGSIYGQFIETCWQKAGQDLKKGYITVSEVPKLIREMEAFLGVSLLLSKQELAIVDKMAREKPTLKLFQRDVEKFVLRLVKADSMEAFLKKRANTTKFTLTRLLDNFTSYSSKWGDLTRPFSQPEDTVRLRERFDSRLGAGDAKLPKLEPREPTASLPFRNVKDEFKREENRDYEERFVLTTANGGNRRNSVTYHSDDREELRRKITQLEKLCERYETQLAQKDDPQRAQLLEKFQKELDEQDKLIKSLQARMGLGGPRDRKEIIANLPFIKQYLQRGPSTQIADVVALVLAFFVILNILKFVYYTILWLLSSSTTPFSWLQQLPWLEYWVYNIADWLEG